MGGAAEGVRLEHAAVGRGEWVEPVGGGGVCGRRLGVGGVGGRSPWEWEESALLFFC